MSHVLLISNDNIIKVTGVKNERDNTFQNNADVKVTLKDEAGNNISGQSWPLALSFIAGSNGDYDGIIQDALSLEAGRAYIAEVSITLSGGGDAIIKKRVTAQERSI